MFNTLSTLPPDPILGLSAAYKKDSNPEKIDLGVGVYKDEAGNTPIMEAVSMAQERWLQQEDSKVYITPQGVQGFIDQLLELILGGDLSSVSNRLAAVQAPGGCGALRILAELIKRANPDTTVWVSDPTWANHIPLIGDAELNIKTYPYFDKTSASINFDGMVDQLNEVQKGDIVLLHGCCHNPTGADLTPAQWDEVLSIAQKTGFVPFVDLAYLGFGDNLVKDAYGIRLLVQNLPEVILAASCSKNFGLYRERVGLAAVLGQSTESKNALQSQLQRVARGIYSMPPSYGGQLVNIILADATMRDIWQKEVDSMRERMQTLRSLLVKNVHNHGIDRDFSFIEKQKGMFSYLCISPEQVVQMREKFSVYFVESSRVNIAGINQQNVEPLAHALAKVL